MAHFPPTARSPIGLPSFSPSLLLLSSLWEDFRLWLNLSPLPSRPRTVPLSGSSGKSPDTWNRRDPRPSPRPMPATATPNEGMPMFVPIGRRLLDRTTDLLPALEPPTFQRQRSQDLPPRFDQIQVRRVLRLEHELPPGKRQREQQHI